MTSDKKQIEVLDRWRKITVPETIKQNLIISSLFLAAYEFLKDSIVPRVTEFIRDMNGKERREFDQEIEDLRDTLPSERRKYDLLVYSRWFQKMRALNREEVDNIEQIWITRNDIAHELLKYLIEKDFELDLKYLLQIVDIIEKVDTWWIKEVEIPINPDFDGIEIKGSDIKSPKVMMMEYLISIALESGQEITGGKNGLVH